SNSFAVHADGTTAVKILRPIPYAGIREPQLLVVVRATNALGSHPPTFMSCLPGLTPYHVGPIRFGRPGRATGAEELAAIPIDNGAAVEYHLADTLHARSLRGEPFVKSHMALSGSLACTGGSIRHPWTGSRSAQPRGARVGASC